MNHIKYFTDHPEALDAVRKAYYAYHAPHPRLDSKAHFFDSDSRKSRCVWCDRSREQVRWDEFQPECSSRQHLPYIKETILTEENMFHALIEKGKDFIPKYIDKHGMSGQSLAILHHTHGYDPETVISVMEFDEREHLPGYEAAMAEHRRKSGNFGEF